MKTLKTLATWHLILTGSTFFLALIAIIIWPLFISVIPLGLANLAVAVTLCVIVLNQRDQGYQYPPQYKYPPPNPWDRRG